MTALPARWRVGALVLAAACWGAGTAVSKQAVAELPPLTLLAVQLAVSVGFMAVFARLRGDRWPAGREGRLLGRLGLLNPGLAYALSLFGLTQISASLSVLLWAVEPIFILALAAAVLREAVGPAIVAASAVAVCGLVIAVFDPSATGSLVGVGFTLAGVGACAIYTVATRRWLPGTSDSTVGVVLAQQVNALAFAAVIVLVVAAGGGVVLPGHLSAGAIASAVVSGLLYYAFAYSFYLTALRTVPASVAAASFYLIPIFGVGVAWLFGERLQPLQWVGGALVVAAVASITIRGQRALRPAIATG